MSDETVKITEDQYSISTVYSSGHKHVLEFYLMDSAICITIGNSDVGPECDFHLTFEQMAGINKFLELNKPVDK